MDNIEQQAVEEVIDEAVEKAVKENVKNVQKEKKEPNIITKKDPARVEQGKKLAAISKEAKEKKMRQRIEQELLQEKSFAGDIFLSLIVPLSLSVSTFLFGAWLASSLTNKNEEKDEPQHQPSKIVIPEKKEPKRKKFEDLN